MPYFAKVSSVIDFLGSEIPTQDISSNPVVVHPHNTSRAIQERLPAEVVKKLSALEPGRAMTATAREWAAIAAAIALCTFFWHPVLYVLAVMFIGARQHALIIMGHDASHYRYLPKRWQNELFANLFLMWPVFASVEGFRKFHSTHHQYTNLPHDGNRHIWYTHDAAGELAPNWVFPKTLAGLALLLLRRAFFLTGIFWIPHPVTALDGRGEDFFLPVRRRSAHNFWRLVRLSPLLDCSLLHLAYRHSVVAGYLR